MAFQKTGDTVPADETFEVKKKTKLSDFNGDAAELNKKLEQVTPPTNPETKSEG